MVVASLPRSKSIARGKLLKGVDVERLTSAMEGARRSMQKYRAQRVKAVQQLAGMHYSDGGSETPVPVNLIGMYVQIMGTALISQDPRFMLSTMDQEQTAAVSACQDWMNEEAKDTYLCDTLQRVVIDALFSVGITKVALADPGDAAASGWKLTAGQPFAERIDLDDFVYDVYAHDFRKATFLGHRYRVPLAVADEIYEQGRKGELESTFEPDFNPTGDTKINYVGRGTRQGDEFEEHVTLWEIYLPRHGVVLTFLDDPATGSNDDERTLLLVQKWIGPPCGPYHFLGFGVIPGSAMPKAPVMDLIDLHRAVQMCYIKLIEDTDRWKSVLLVRGGATDDAGRLKQLRNGEMGQCDNPGEMKETTFGGPGPGVHQMAIHFKELFSWLAGNLDIVGGLSPQSRTATQDKMLNENSSRTVGDKQQQVLKHTISVGDALLWYYWNHPQKVMESHYSPPGVPEYSMKREVYPDDGQPLPPRPGAMRRSGSAPKIKVDPYSLSHSTPQQRLAFLNGFIQQSAPMLPIWAQQGVAMDAQAYVGMVSKYGDEPEIKNLFRISDPIAQQGGDGGGDAPGMPANTSREYIRRSLGGDSAGAKANQDSNAASGGYKAFGSE